MTNEMPKEADSKQFYAVRHKTLGTVSVGRVLRADWRTECEPLWFAGQPYCHTEAVFCDYDWHKIELPEGWR